MGCDGGTIPKRSEIVKNKSTGQTRDKQADLVAKWYFCHLSGFPLTKPIVACQLGFLYNKERLIEYLLDLKVKGEDPNLDLEHIRSLKDVREINLKEKSDDEDGVQQQPSGNEKFRAQFKCPVSGLDMNGKYKFYFYLSCGCAVSEKAIREVPDHGVCLVCSKPCDPDLDLITINGDADEIKILRTRMTNKRKSQKSEKQNRKKHKADSESNIDMDHGKINLTETKITPVP